MRTGKVDRGIWIDWVVVRTGGRRRMVKALAWEPALARFGRLKTLQEALRLGVGSPEKEEA